MKYPVTFTTLIGVAALALSSTAFAANVSTTASLSKGAANSIAPNRPDIKAASGSTAQSTLESRADICVLQNFTGSSANKTNIFTFGADDLAIRITPQEGEKSGTGKEISSSGFLSSYGSGYLIHPGMDSKAPFTYSVTIDFGSYEASSKAFTTGKPGVAVAAFTMVAPGVRYRLTDSIQVKFLSTSGKVLSTQAIPASDLDTATTKTVSIYFGYAASGDSIASIQIDINQKAGTVKDNSPLLGLDDIAFATE
ncbi:hypothetical protein [Ruficoccus sp. ZRK36]|uniref:hypothetical protein n=1 Tax=Ruficoccus sp. ZRK36 TaxID=2866311 RepID=UPI001C73C052|nr:hypothetical protein [Ruficoccus sp. ZRK36]QYY34518.1 hypothetical protein K0V07_09380 [Ruficoccus sp. ZRK36]